jgi:hypothetical protein
MTELEHRERDLAARVARIIDPSSAQAVGAALAILLVFYVGLAFAYGDAIPLFEAPDEFSHVHYATFVYANERLPRQEPLEVPGEGMQAPLLYVIAAPLLGYTTLDVTWAAEQLARVAGPFYAHPMVDGGGPALRSYQHGYRQFLTDGSLEPLRRLRITSLAFGMIAVTLTFSAVWRLSRDARFSLLAGALIAFDPQFLFSSGYFSNDTAAAAIGAAALWIIARALEDPGVPKLRYYLAGGCLVAVGALTKTSTLPGLAAAALTLIAIDRRPWRQIAVDAGFAAGCVLALAGPYAVWALEHRGGLLGVNAVVASAVGMTRVERFGGLLPFLTQVYWDSTFESFWARFGWFNVVVPKATYLVFFALTWTAVLGLVAGRARLPAEELHSRALNRYLLAAFGLTLASHFAMNLAIVNPQGRLLFPALSQVAFLLAIGLVRLIGNDRRMLPLTTGVVMLLVAMDVYCLRGVILPAYH